MPTSHGAHYERQVVSQQKSFLKAFAHGASFSESARIAKAHRQTVNKWIESDKNGFTKLFYEAEADFKDGLIEIAMTRIREQGAKDSPLLLITMLNAYIPERFRPNTIATEEVARETISELRKLSKQAFEAHPREKEEEMASKSPLQQVEELLTAKKQGQPKDAEDTTDS